MRGDDEISARLASIGETIERYKRRQAALSALNDAVQPSAHFTAHEKKLLRAELERSNKEQQQHAKQFATRVHTYETKLVEIERTLQGRQEVIDAVCTACPDVRAHMDLCHIFRAQHEKIASQLQRTKHSIVHPAPE